MIGHHPKRSAAAQNLSVLQAVVVLAALVFVIVNLVADLVAPLLDSRLTLLWRPARRPDTASAPSLRTVTE